MSDPTSSAVNAAANENDNQGASTKGIVTAKPNVFVQPPAPKPVTELDDLASADEVFRPGDDELFVPQAEKTPKAAAAPGVSAAKSPDAEDDSLDQDGLDDASSDPLFSDEVTKPNAPAPKGDDK